MPSKTILLIVQGFQAAIAAAPQAIELVKQAKEFFTTLFSKGLITKETQDRVHARMDEWVACLTSGTVPPEFTVEPDPQ
jgi:hypothetical protein